MSSGEKRKLIVDEMSKDCQIMKRFKHKLRRENPDKNPYDMTNCCECGINFDRIEGYKKGQFMVYRGSILGQTEVCSYFCKTIATAGLVSYCDLCKKPKVCLDIDRCLHCARRFCVFCRSDEGWLECKDCDTSGDD
jgi:hypothetical protein